MYKYPLFDGANPKNPQLFMQHLGLGVTPCQYMVDHLLDAHVTVFTLHDCDQRERRVTALIRAAIFCIRHWFGQWACQREASRR
jgi:hypothetical protein